MAKKRIYRRYIRMNGELVPSPEFTTAQDASDWYDAMKRRKQFAKQGLAAPIMSQTKDKTTLLEFAAKWLSGIEKRYGLATFSGYEEKVRLHIGPALGHLAINSVTTKQVKDMLTAITDSGLSRETRRKTKVTLSLIYQEAIEQDPPLALNNPAAGIKFKEKRIKKALPKIIASEADVQHFMATAESISMNALVLTSLGVMVGLRMSEMIALRWRHVDNRRMALVIREKYSAKEKRILFATKQGENAERTIPIPEELDQILQDHRAQSPNKAENDFVLSHPNGKLISPRALAELHDRVREKSGIDVTIHSLRHTFGSHFVANGGELRVLRDLMGHTTILMTEQYTQLSEKVVLRHRNVVRYGLTRGTQGRQGDTAVTQKAGSKSNKKQETELAN